ELGAVPPAGLHHGVGLRHPAGQREHEGDGVLGGGDGVPAGRVHDDDALAGGGGHVDVIDPDAGPGDGPELARVVEQLGGDLGGGPDDGGVGGAEGGLEVVALEAGAVVH